MTSDDTSLARERVLLLSPSRGLGGGIERYVATLEWALSTQCVRYQRVDLQRPGATGHAQMMREVQKSLREDCAPTRFIVAHRALMPIASLLARRSKCVRGMSVLCHGSEAWNAEIHPRRYLESRLLRQPYVRLVATSGFTAGAISHLRPATILPPGLSADWYRTLVGSPAACGKQRPGVNLVTAFRLEVWKEKGLPELMAAVAALGRSDVHLTVCGSGEPPRSLLDAVRGQPWCTLRSGLSDTELAGEFAAADLFVLATRTRTGRHAAGEGFGLVLIEAQVAGTPVVGPAYGGSHDAYLDRLTGVAPVNESAAELTTVLSKLLADPHELAEMGQRAAVWARDSFAPERYAQLAVSRLL